MSDGFRVSCDAQRWRRWWPSWIFCEIQSTILRHRLSGSLHKLNFIIIINYVRRAGLLEPPIGSTNRRGGVA